jgi:hypothetical protein
VAVAEDHECLGNFVEGLVPRDLLPLVRAAVACPLQGEVEARAVVEVLDE